MYQSSHTGSATALFSITPHDSTNFAKRARAIYVGVGGNISIVGGDGVAVTLVGVPQGMLLPAEAIRVNAAGTTASSLVGLA